MEDGAATVALSCSHVFHAACIVPWLQTGNRSCPTCRDKPPRQRLGDDDSSDASDYGELHEDGYDSVSSSASHRALHEEWDRTWRTYVAAVDASIVPRRNAIARARRLAKATRPQDRKRAREASKLVGGLDAWKDKAKERAVELSAAQDEHVARNLQLSRAMDGNYRWFSDKVEKLHTKHKEKNDAAVAKADLPGIRKKVGRLSRAADKAKQARWNAEEKLATFAGWTAPPVPQLPAGLMECTSQPTGLMR